ncbi:hypothetical protein [Halococcus saccharolyticus]|uniref:Uncharacterized protein n=1 Tax=Halococcus saccharolyticus DSM 5350 TaxID=1227455 RepID=M0MT95_9EURY|nr:hypothetical protein [Halococcus saccharolyticus]EMA47959.1 hypothetical protein C449_00765 [Halococcus saccharolyticus DSM 5350]
MNTTIKTEDLTKTDRPAHYNYHTETICTLYLGFEYRPGEGLVLPEYQEGTDELQKAIEGDDELTFRFTENRHGEPALRVSRLKEGWRDCPFDGLPTPERVRKAREYWEEGKSLEEIDSKPEEVTPTMTCKCGNEIEYRGDGEVRCGQCGKRLAVETPR